MGYINLKSHILTGSVLKKNRQFLSVLIRLYQLDKLTQNQMA